LGGITISNIDSKDLIQQLLDEAGIDGISADDTIKLFSSLKAKRQELVEAVESRKIESSDELLDFAKTVQSSVIEYAANCDVLPGSAIAIMVNFTENEVKVTVPRISAKGIQTSYALNSDGSLVSAKEVERNKRTYTKRA
jgi:hypothetical protein